MDKKKLAEASDLTDCNAGYYRLLCGRKPSYPEWLGLWLNRGRANWRRAWPVAYGSAVTLGLVEPPMDFFRANADGEGAAKRLMAMHELARRNRDG